MRRIVLLGLLLVVSACRDITGPTVFYDQEFTLSPGEQAHVVNTRTFVAFDRVENDSRCPADAICIQGGDALVKIRVIEEGRSAPYDLHTGDMAPISHAEVTVALIQLAPYPFSSSPIQPDEYRATLKVTKRQ